MKLRVLFVDDEPNILNGIRRMLHGQRSEWDMAFVGNGPRALETMAEKKYDVIVSDMRMPGMNGAELLAQVKEAYPKTIRIILSGHSEKESIMRAVRPAHQYLAKPCDKLSLIDTISKAWSLRALMATDGLKSMISKIETLPSLPTLYLQVAEALEQPDCSLEKLAKIISKDPAMTAKIMQLVNSAFFGLPKKMTDISRAVVYLGLETIRSLVLSIGLFSKFNPKELPFLDLESLFDHSFRTANTAKNILKSEKANKDALDEAFMAGLLHDLGKLILAQNIPDVYADILTTAKTQSTGISEIEMSDLGATHAEVGAYLLGLWGLPDNIVEAVAFHHHPEKTPARNLGALIAVHAANVMDHYPKEVITQPDADRLNLDYLDRIGCLDRLASWHAIHAANGLE